MDADQVGQALERILQSPQFRSAHNRARFLRYVVTKTLAGEQGHLKEYTIGVEVFGRGESFDPKVDGIVRVQAGHLRRYLERYYAESGRDEPVQILIPKGHYIPEFRARELSEPAVEAGASVRPRAARLTLRLLLAAVGTAAILVLGARSVAVLRNTGDPVFERGVSSAKPGRTSGSVYSPVRHPSAATPALGTLVWDGFLQTDAASVLAVGIPQFFTGGDIWVRDVTINAHTARTNSQLEALQARLRTPLEPNVAYTGIGEAYGMYMISKFYVENARQVRLARGPAISWDNLKYDNVIFLTSARFSTLADELAYPSDFVHVLEPGKHNRVLNRHPRTGEQREYAARVPRDGVDYAVITRWPGKLPDRRILILSGSYTWGTQGAAEYVTEPGYLRELDRHLEACRRDAGLDRHPEFFQVLLRVEVRDYQPVTITYVTHHDLSIDDARPPHDAAAGVQSADAGLKYLPQRD